MLAIEISVNGEQFLTGAVSRDGMMIVGLGLSGGGDDGHGRPTGNALLTVLARDGDRPDGSGSRRSLAVGDVVTFRVIDADAGVADFPRNPAPDRPEGPT